MGWRFRKSIKILPGVRLNFGKRGYTSTTIGGKWFKTNVSSRGVRHTLSVPGTGVSYQTKTYRNAPVDSGSENTDTRLYWYCASCYIANLPDTRVCHRCGGAYNPNPQESHPALASTNGKLLLILLGAGFALIFVASIIGAILSSSTQPSTTRQPFSDSPASKSSVNSIPPTTSKSQPKSLSQTKPSTAKKAVVISENANLRKSANQNSEVVQTVAEGRNVDVIQQQGAWFLVSYGGQVGWMHGNTIRLIEADSIKITETSPTSNYDSPSYHTSPYSGSGSPSYDYRPKSVHVRGYYRKDGTYVRSHTRRSPR